MEKQGAPNGVDSNHIQAVDKRDDTELNKEKKAGKEMGNSAMAVHIWTKQSLIERRSQRFLGIWAFN